jgi:hypothetical protein
MNASNRIRQSIPGKESLASWNSEGVLGHTEEAIEILSC